MSRENSTESIAWPGFVDILSAVIIMFVFLLLITSIVVSVLGREYRKQLITDMETQKNVYGGLTSEERDQETQKNITEKDLRYAISNGETEVVDQVLEQLAMSASESQETFEQSQQFCRNINSLKVGLSSLDADDIGFEESLLGNEVKVVFHTNGAVVNEKARQRLLDALVKISDGKLDDHIFQIVSVDTSSSLSLSRKREISFVRAMQLRNVLLEESVGRENVQVELSGKAAAKEEKAPFGVVRIRAIKRKPGMPAPLDGMDPNAVPEDSPPPGGGSSPPAPNAEGGKS